MRNIDVALHDSW
jgi:hypothetical protein